MDERDLLAQVEFHKTRCFESLISELGRLLELAGADELLGSLFKEVDVDDIFGHLFNFSIHQFPT